MKSRTKYDGVALQKPQAPLTGAYLNEISLRPVTVADRGAIKKLVLDPEQELFAGSVDAIFNDLQNSRYPDMEHPFAIVVPKRRIGFFILREKQAAPDWALDGAFTLHSFRICRACQGKGYGRAGAALAISWVRQNRPDVRQLMLAVNERNGLAKSVYLNSGFVDTGEIFRGPIGDQHILSFQIYRHDG
ncbi:GNAT family N-acetyltransferase (plasmid) [Mesorhizobium sp. AR07]|uniref:GNAT family N-acetyltransferase n=1 Tax=Mesorhizobium sp. AR07 TaxID=2865838 RepID=UPI002160B0FC|nr:GNAT family N-acetyltransferase [Mesorhizobium sp. AR07]UVK49502.1 GNAT family N-acetyltransferase [Mesorhizobium sp. AR07]